MLLQQVYRFLTESEEESTTLSVLICHLDFSEFSILVTYLPFVISLNIFTVIVPMGVLHSCIDFSRRALDGQLGLILSLLKFLDATVCSMLILSFPKLVEISSGFQLIFICVSLDLILYCPICAFLSHHSVVFYSVT